LLSFGNCFLDGTIKSNFQATVFPPNYLKCSALHCR